jgi:hypothetical protein
MIKHRTNFGEILTFFGSTIVINCMFCLLKEKEYQNSKIQTRKQGLSLTYFGKNIHIHMIRF